MCNWTGLPAAKEEGGTKAIVIPVHDFTIVGGNNNNNNNTTAPPPKKTDPTSPHTSPLPKRSPPHENVYQYYYQYYLHPIAIVLQSYSSSLSLLGYHTANATIFNPTFKICWDAVTVLLSIAVGSYTTYVRIHRCCGADADDQKKKLQLDSVTLFMQIWCCIDIVVNIVTDLHQRKRRQMQQQQQHSNSCSSNRLNNSDHNNNNNSNDQLLTIIDTKTTTNDDKIAIVYLSWFLFDIVTCVIQWENIIIPPLLIKHHKRNIFRKIFSITRLTPLIKREWYWIDCSRQLFKSIGLWRKKKRIRFITLIPKYIIFFKNMRIVLFIRMIRQIRRIRNQFALYKKIYNTDNDHSTDNATTTQEGEGEEEPGAVVRAKKVPTKRDLPNKIKGILKKSKQAVIAIGAKKEEKLELRKKLESILKKSKYTATINKQKLM